MNSPYRLYPSAHNDVLSSQLQGSMAQRELEAARRQSELSQQSREFAQRYALQGLQDNLASRQQANSLTQARLNGVFGPAGNILRGLFS